MLDHGINDEDIFATAIDSARSIQWENMQLRADAARLRAQSAALREQLTHRDVKDLRYRLAATWDLALRARRQIGDLQRLAGFAGDDGAGAAGRRA